MITQQEGRPEGTLEFHFTGKITSEDYKTTLVPAIEDALAEHERVKLLCVMGDEFEGYAFEAVWADTKLGLDHWKGFDRIAVVTEIPWLRGAIKAISFMFPCPVMMFDLNELNDARRWLSESLGSIHLDPLGGPVLHVSLIGKLEPSAYEHAEEDLTRFIAEHGKIRLLVDLSEFDGWESLSALGQHVSLLREHRHAPEKVAVVGNEAWQRLAQRIFGRFTKAEVRFFPTSDLTSAEDWVAQST